jgi:four helix bundle protein
MYFISYVYAASAGYPKREQFGLTDQIRRAATAIALNIAEGSGSGTDKEFVRFLRISYRSVYEVITAAEIAKTLHYGNSDKQDKIIEMADEIAAMLAGLLKRLKAES